jgi:hypothetical protein
MFRNSLREVWGSLRNRHGITPNTWAEVDVQNSRDPDNSMGFSGPPNIALDCIDAQVILLLRDHTLDPDQRTRLSAIGWAAADLRHAISRMTRRERAPNEYGGDPRTAEQRRYKGEDVLDDPTLTPLVAVRLTTTETLSRDWEAKLPPEFYSSVLANLSRMRQLIRYPTSNTSNELFEIQNDMIGSLGCLGFMELALALRTKCFGFGMTDDTLVDLVDQAVIELSRRRAGLTECSTGS